MTILREALDLLDRCHAIESTAMYHHGVKTEVRLAMAAELRAQSRVMASMHHVQARAMRRAA